jgi:hypothetical protein
MNRECFQVSFCLTDRVFSCPTLEKISCCDGTAPKAIAPIIDHHTGVTHLSFWVIAHRCDCEDVQCHLSELGASDDASIIESLNRCRYRAGFQSIDPLVLLIGKEIETFDCVIRWQYPKSM